MVSMLSAFCLNTLMLIIATLGLYSINDEARAIGFGHSGLYMLIVTIPIVTWINFIILQFVKRIS